MNELPTALFVQYPSRIENLTRPHFSDWRKPYVVEQEVSLGNFEYENFITDFCVTRWFIEEYMHLCHIDKDGVWHCILIKQKGKLDGVLVMSEGMAFPKWAAYLSNEEVSE